MIKQKFFCSIVLVFSFLFFVPSIIIAGNENVVDTATTSDVYMLKGELENLSVSSLTRLSMTNPEVVDIVSATDKEILLIAKDVGQSVLFVWDENGKRPILIHVFAQNLELIKERVTNLLKSANVSEVKININEAEGKLIVVGDVPEDKKAIFDQVVGPFAEYMINLSKQEDNKDLVQIDLQITELSTTLDKQMGLDWSAGGSNSFSLSYPETLPTLDGSPGDFFKIGDFRRTNALLATVNAFIKEGKGKILSEPKLVVVSGEEASFLVGGQIPIRTSTTTSVGAQESVTFKDYGITMSITPKIIKGKIDILASAEISDIDDIRSTASDVAFLTRSAQTRLYLDDGQTIVLAGLIKSNKSQSVKRVPYLSKVPVLGMMFRSRISPVNETELVISLTPHILTDRGQEEKMLRAKSEGLAKEKAAPAEGRSKYKRIAKIKPTHLNMTEYMKKVQNKLLTAIRYPAEAQTYGWEGTVKLSLLILNDGTLALASVKESSGYEAFDQDAVEAAQRAAPYDTFPADSNLQELEVTIPIVYNLQKNK